MNSSEIVLAMQGVKKSYPTVRGPVVALRRVDVAVSPGEFVALTGPSGSGKSTFLHLAALLDGPTGGNVLFDGREVSHLTESELCLLRKYSVGMVFQKYCLLPHRTVLQNVLFRFRYLAYDSAVAERQAMHALELMDLSNLVGTPVRFLSGGEMQRVAIARAVALKPRLLIADEPTGNLDRSAASTVMECFRQLNQTGMTVVLATHNEALLRFCTRHLTCHDGVIEE